jgi:hypothetical protein
MAKHYITKDKDGIIINAFSDSFEKPQQDDICIEENGGRHYNLDLKDSNGDYKYKYENDEVIEIVGDRRDINKELLKIRLKRNSLLKDTDWVILPDVPISTISKTAFETYRQELRDLPASINDLSKIDSLSFPDIPEYKTS